MPAASDGDCFPNASSATGSKGRLGRRLALPGAALMGLGMVLTALGCASPTSQGHVVMRLAPGLPRAWPHPVPLGETGALELTMGALTDAEAQPLAGECRAAVAAALHPTRAANTTDDVRVVVSRMVVDTSQDGAGKRLAVARAVVELRRGNRPLAIGTGVARLLSGAPSFRSDGVEPREVTRALRAACHQAARALLEPPPALPPSRLGALQAALASPQATARMDAVVALGATLDAQVGPLVSPLLADPDSNVRRASATVLGNLCREEDVVPLCNMAETDVDLGVRVDAVNALNKMLACNPALKPVMRAAREEAALRRAAPPPTEDVPDAAPTREILEGP